MAITSTLSRRSKQIRRGHADRRRQIRTIHEEERRKAGGRRDSDLDFAHLPYGGA